MTSTARLRASIGCARGSAGAQPASGDPLLHGDRWHSHRLFDRAARPAARQGGQLAQPSRVRMGKPDLEALVFTRCRRITASSATTSAETACPRRRGRRELRHVGAGPRNGRRCPRPGTFRAARDLTGRAVAIAYAVRHPERVSRLVLYGGFAAGLNYTATGGGTRGATRAEQPDRVSAGV